MLLPYVFKVPRSFSGNHVCETAYIKDVVCVDQKGVCKK